VSEQVDAVVLGMGVGGELVAEQLADAGLAVVGIDGGLVGGECPYWGCIPTKMMIRAANALAEARRVGELAGSSTVTPDWAPVAARIRDEATDDWNDRVAVERFEEKGGRFVRGAGRLDGPGRVTVGGDAFEAGRAIVVATGTKASAPPIRGLDDVDYWTNREAVEAKELPESLLVLGGGAIGLELAQVFARFGVPVTIVEAAPRLVAPEEPESSELIADVLRGEGLEVRVGVDVESARADDGRAVLTLSGDDGDTEELSAERLLVATGRRADLAAIGAGSVGIDEAQRGIPVDERLRVPGVDRLWAIGDVTGIGPFTHMAVYQGRIAAADILGDDPTPADYRALPHVTFTDPEIGSVGATEAQAREDGVAVRVGSAPVSVSTRGWIHKAGNEGFVKLVEDAERGHLVGATSVGPVGGEVLGLLTLAVHEQVPTDHLRQMIYAYPTFHRGIEDALKDLAGQ
jgi:pyruvate/2-oxoglutarate dehydrogenase complex dihydrolipoamide dehydrogenase (E3) component